MCCSSVLELDFSHISCICYSRKFLYLGNGIKLVWNHEGSLGREPLCPLHLKNLYPLYNEYSKKMPYSRDHERLTISSVVYITAKIDNWYYGVLKGRRVGSGHESRTYFPSDHESHACLRPFHKWRILTYSTNLIYITGNWSVNLRSM